MKRSIILLCAVWAFLLPVAHAQQVAAVPDGEGAHQEVQEMTAYLQEVHAALTDQWKEMDGLAATVDRIAAKRFVQIRDEIKTELVQAEAALERLRNAEEAQWPALREEVGRVRDELKAKVAFREKGMQQARGE